MTTTHGWPTELLGKLLSRTDQVAVLSATDKYREVTIRLWGKGVVLRRVALGSEISGRRFRVSTDQFILSRIDARNGAMGLVPPELDGAVVTNDFPSFSTDTTRLLPSFLGWLSKTPSFVEACRSASEGTTNRVRLKEDRFFKVSIPLPPIEEQRRIVSRIERIASKVHEARITKTQIEGELRALMRSRFAQIADDAPRRKLESVAPLIRRKANVQPGAQFPELGIRSFGKGTFHKPALDYLAVGSKKLYSIEPGDLVFNNVFAWEGAIAVAQPEDNGRFGSHRFITCIPAQGVATAEFLCFYFLTPEGLEKIGEASPGGAGRNRTLGLEKLSEILVPVPDYGLQTSFGDLMGKIRAMRLSHESTVAGLNALLPSVLDRAFRGEL